MGTSLLTLWNANGKTNVNEHNSTLSDARNEIS